MRDAAHKAGAPLIGVLLVAALCATTRADNAMRPGDRVLLVSTRPVGCSTDSHRLSRGVYCAELCDEECGSSWREAGLEQAVGGLDPALPIVFYVHGNLIEAPDARRRGLDVYRRLTRCAGEGPPVQFVVFSWCSGKVRGLLRDYRVKAQRTRPVAWQLAWLVDRLPEGSSVGLIGYSYGARVSTGAAHLLGGGSLGGLAYEKRSAGPRQLHAVLMASALDSCWLASGQYHGRAMDEIDTLLATVNPRDPAMRFYKWVPKGSNPDALGGVGPRGLDREAASRVSVRRVSGSVGRSHDLYRYLASPGLMRSAWRRLAVAGQPTPEPTEVPLAAR